jgi:hypothetical protein
MPLYAKRSSLSARPEELSESETPKRLLFKLTTVLVRRPGRAREQGPVSGGPGDSAVTAASLPEGPLSRPGLTITRQLRSPGAHWHLSGQPRH